MAAKKIFLLIFTIVCGMLSLLLIAIHPNSLGSGGWAPVLLMLIPTFANLVLTKPSCT